MKDLVKVKLIMTCVNKNKILEDLKNINCEKMTIEKLSSKTKIRQGDNIKVYRVYNITLSMITSRKLVYDICDILDKRIDREITQDANENEILSELSIETSYDISVEEIEQPELTCDKLDESMQYHIGAKESAERVREEVFGKEQNFLSYPKDKEIKIGFLKLI